MERARVSLVHVIRRVVLASAVLPALMLAACYVDHAVAVRHADAATSGAAAASPPPDGAPAARRTIAVGDTVRLQSPAHARRDRVVQWSSTAPTVASVSAQGMVIGLSLGNAIVTGTSKSGFVRLNLTVAARTPPPPPAPPAPPTPPAPPPPPPAPPTPPPSGALGVNAPLGRLLPANNPWNQPVDTAQLDPNSAAIIANIGLSKAFHPDFGANWNGGPFGIAYIVVAGSQPRVPVTFVYADESDVGPYPVPPTAPIEGGASSTGDRHVLVVDRDNWKLYELYAAYPQAGGGWHAGSGAIFDLNSNALRPAGWTSADAAGLPILPGLVRYDEVSAGTIAHALRFTVSRSRRAYIPPAT
ncbi:MAG: Ig-like domain-containing protein, partial [Gemmatimonas sp.]